MANRVVQGLAALVAVLGLVGGAQAGDEGCEPGWVDDLFCPSGVSGVQPGTGTSVCLTTVEWDDGSGPSLFVAGAFAHAGCVPDVANIAQWDGESWSALQGSNGTGTDNLVDDMVVFDDGSGPALFVGGGFTIAGGLTVNGVAKWDGSDWYALSSQDGTGVDGRVLALEVFDDGSGPALYAAGQFSHAGGIPVSNIARWDGQSWSALGESETLGPNGLVIDLIPFDDGSGPALYAGGQFALPGDPNANSLAKWDGTGWSSVSDNESFGTNTGVVALEIFDDGGGPALYAAGRFFSVGGQSAKHIARWDGSSWSAFGGPDDGTATIRGMKALELNGDLALFVAGAFDSVDGLTTNHVARWDGAKWSALEGSIATGLDDSAWVVGAYDSGTGPALVVGGYFGVAGGHALEHVALWDGQTWLPPSRSVQDIGLDNTVVALKSFNDGNGPALYAGGGFLSVGGDEVNRIVRWDGEEWTPLVGNGGVGLDDNVQALAVLDSGKGAELVVGGEFRFAGNQYLGSVASWNGSEWSSFIGSDGASINGRVRAFAVFDDGSGPALYAGGRFTLDGVRHRVARWDGENWHPVPGLGGEFHDVVFALHVFDDGTGPALYAGGQFMNAGDLPVNHIARWDGDVWSAVGTGDEVGVDNVVYSVETFETDGVEALYVGGNFDYAGGVLSPGIAKWMGSEWLPVVGESDVGLDGAVFTMTVIDDGVGSALYVGGGFSEAGGTPMNSIARWDGAQWSALPGTAGDGVERGFVSAISEFRDKMGQAIYAGGSLIEAGGVAKTKIAKWRTCATEPCYGDVTNDGLIDLADLNLVLANFGQSSADGDATGDGSVDLADLNAVLGAFGTVCP